MICAQNNGCKFFFGLGTVLLDATIPNDLLVYKSRNRLNAADIKEKDGTKISSKMFHSEGDEEEYMDEVGDERGEDYLLYSEEYMDGDTKVFKPLMETEEQKRAQILRALFRPIISPLSTMAHSKCVVSLCAPALKDLVLFKNQSICQMTLDELKKEAKPSPYGDLKTGTSPVDLKVRNAMEIPNAPGVFSYTPLGQEFLSTCCELIAEHLLFNGKEHRYVKLEINKLNLYLEGGM